MSYVETEEQRMLRKQVGDIGRKYGREMILNFIAQHSLELPKSY